MSRVERLLDHFEESVLYLGLIAVANSFKQQLAQRSFLEGELAEHVEHLAAQGGALFLKLVQEAVINFAFARIFRHQVPEMAHLGLADAVNAAEALLQAVGIP